MAARPKALVLGSDSGSFLSVVRSLGRQGIDVHIGWCPAEAPAARSRYVRQVHRLPSPAGDDAWIDDFAALMVRERFDLILPTNDPTLIPLQVSRERLEPLGRLYLVNDRAFEVAFDKVKTRELALANDVPVAPGYVARNAESLEAGLNRRRYPVIVKPQASFNPGDLDQRNWVKRAYSEEEAREAVLELLPRGQVVIEDNVTGTGWGVEVLAANGQVLLSQQHERVHEPLHGGGSSYRRTVPRSPQLIQAVGRLVKDLDYTGVAMFEFKGRPDTGEWILIEINARFWGSLPLSLAAGIDFPYALWQLLVDGRTQFPNTYRTGVYARNFKRDLKWMWLNLRADRTDPVLATRPLPKVATEITNALRLREHVDQFTLDDPRPGLAELGQMTRSLQAVARVQVITHTALRRRQQLSARRALAHARTVLFVCYGNICRSPFAAAIARAVVPPSVEIFSAGTSELEGRRSPSTAREVAREFGAELDMHRSRTLTGELVARADVILVFDLQNRGEVLRRFPQARGKVHLVGAIGDGPISIADPIEGDRNRFRSSYQAIASAIEAAGRAYAAHRGVGSSV